MLKIQITIPSSSDHCTYSAHPAWWYQPIKPSARKIMTLTSDLPKLSLEELYGQVMFSNRLTSTDRQKLQKTLLRESVSNSEMAIIDRLLCNVRRGWLQVTD